MDSSRRSVLLGLSVMSAINGKPVSRPWKPRLGVLAEYDQANLKFAAEHGFTSIGLFADRGAVLDVTTQLPDTRVEQIRAAIDDSKLYASVLGAYQINHTAEDPDERTKNNRYFRNVIQLAGKLKIPFVGTGSGKMPGRNLADQVAEIARVYEQQYFSACQENKVRILWEPWAGGPNVATGPIGYEALFKAFGSSPYVGLQFDPSHLVWQMMDPIQTARDFAGKIYDVHLKDTEIRWPILRKVGINPWNKDEWWRFRIPGSGSVDWRAFFTVLMEAGYRGAMNIENEDELYGTPYNNRVFTDSFKDGFLVAKQYLQQFVAS
jgi:sugar phosphate isomerase/epimerase